MPKSSSKAAKQALFLAAIERGSSVVEACEHAGVARRTPYKWAEDSEFEAAWLEAEQAQVRELRRVAFELAMDRENPRRERMITFLLNKYDSEPQSVESAKSVDSQEEVGEIQIRMIPEGKDGGDFITFVEG